VKVVPRNPIHRRPKISVYVDKNGRHWQTNEVEMEVELEKDADGNIPLTKTAGPCATRKPGTRRFNLASIQENQ
jgi:hypothetical protein